MASFDITNLYTNVPVDETMVILRNSLIATNRLGRNKIDELMQLLKTILKQNYFSYDNEYFMQEDGLAMGSPLSGVLADLYLNHFENTFLMSSFNKQRDKIKFYVRYVDDTFMIFNGTSRQIENLKGYMNSINMKIQFTLEMENNNCLNFLDLTISKYNDQFRFKIYRKPTTTTVSYTHLCD